MMERELKVMTFNLRVEYAADGVNAFMHRYARILDTVTDAAPDLVGFQEVTEHMAEEMRRGMQNYTLIGCGRERNLCGESMLLAFRTDAFSLLSVDHEWLSLTPRIPGSCYGLDQSPCPRMLTAVLLQSHAMGEPILFVNTHLDHVGKTARLLGATQLVQYLSTHKPQTGHFILTGDFNAVPESPEIRLLTEASPFSIFDCSRNLPGTYHDYGKIPEARRERIDYIFSDADAKEAYVVPDPHPEGVWYSDHQAVCATVEF